MKVLAVSSYGVLAGAELSLAHLLRDRLDFESADAHYAHAIAMLRHLGADEEAIGLGLEGYGRLRLLQGRTAEADSLLGQSLAIARKHYKPGDERLAQARTDFGLALLRRGRPAEAESLLVSAIPQLSPYERARGASGTLDHGVVITGRRGGRYVFNDPGRSQQAYGKGRLFVRDSDGVLKSDPADHAVYGGPFYEVCSVIKNNG